jgi:hypothetical protein
VSADVVSAEEAQGMLDRDRIAREVYGMHGGYDGARLARTVITLHRELDAVTAERDTALEECSSLARSRDYGDEMIAATREALGAADDESAVAAASRVTTELAVLRAQLPPLLAVHDALVAAAALPGAGASGEEMVAAVRAQGAEEMLTAVDDLLDTALRHHSGRERDVKLPIEERGAAWERAAAVEALMGDVRALPLPGAEVSR